MKTITLAELEALEAAYDAVLADPDATPEQVQAAFDAAYDDQVLVEDTVETGGDGEPAPDEAVADDAAPDGLPYGEDIPESVSAELRAVVHVGIADMAHLEV